MFLNLIWSYQSAHLNAQEDVARHSITSLACSSVKNAVPNVCVFLLATTVTSLCAPATTIGRPSVEDPNALEWNQSWWLIRSPQFYSNTQRSGTIATEIYIFFSFWVITGTITILFPATKLIKSLVSLEKETCMELEPLS